MKTAEKKAIMAPWLFGFSDIALARWGNMVCGLVLILVNIWAIYGEPHSSVPDNAAGDTVRVRKSKNNKREQVNFKFE